MLGQSPATAPLRRQARDLAGVHVGRVDQAPARIDRRVVEQPPHRPRAGGGEAFLHLLRLLGGVDVDRAVEAGDARAASPASPRAG